MVWLIDQKIAIGLAFVRHVMREEATMVGIPDYARAYWADQKRRCYFGFAGCRACIAFLYARSNGATQKEVNKVAWSLGTTQKDYTNMLRMAKKWGHRIYAWEDELRGGKVYKLVYNPDHRCPRKCDDAPLDWEKHNQIAARRGVSVKEW